jgi:hypothetical protein
MDFATRTETSTSPRQRTLRLAVVASGCCPIQPQVRSSWIAYCIKASFFSGVSLMLMISDLFFFVLGFSSVFLQAIKRFILISFFPFVLQFITFTYQLVTKNSTEKGDFLRLLLKIEIIVIQLL